MTEPEQFVDLTIANITEDQARTVVANTPAEARCHLTQSPRSSADGIRIMALVEDLSFPGARKLLEALESPR
jgi:hypothetical protein